MKKSHNPYKPRCPIDEYAAPFHGGMNTGSREVPRAGDKNKGASRHSRRSSGKRGY